MRISASLAAAALLIRATSAGAADAPAALRFEPVSGLERAEGATALAVDGFRERLAVGDPRGVWLREPDGRVRRALGSGPVHDLAFDTGGALLAATERGLYEIALDGRVTKRPLGPGGARRARRVLVTPVGVFVASSDGILAAAPGAAFEPLDGALPEGEATALAHAPAPAGPGRLYAILGGDLYAAALEARPGLTTRGFARETLASQGGAPLDLTAHEDDLVLLRVRALERLTSSGFETLPLALPPGATPARLAFAGGRAFLASDAGVLVAPGLAGPWERAAGGAGSAPASALAADARRVYAATARGVFAAALAPGTATGAPLTPAVAGSLGRGEPDIGAVQRAALAYLELGRDRMLRLQRNVARRGLLPELTLRGDYGGFRASDEDEDDVVFSSGDRFRLFDSFHERGRDFLVGAALRWELGDTIYNAEEIDVSREVRELIELRDEVLDEVHQLYFERRRVLLDRAQLADSASLEAARLELRARELAAGLDAWTGGWWSRALATPSPRDTDPVEDSR